MKRKTKSIIGVILLIATLIGAVAGISAISKKETKKISDFAFERGKIDENGVYVEDETSIVTSDMFECQGLVVERGFKFNYEYQVFFYNFDGVYLSASEKYTDTKRIDVPELAKFARVVIYTEQKVGFLDVTKIARTLDIKVSKVQNFELYNYFALDTSNKDKIRAYGNGGTGVNLSGYLNYYGAEDPRNVLATGWSPVQPINVTGWKNVYLKFNVEADSKDVIYFFVDANQEIVPVESTQKRLNGGTLEEIVLVPEGAVTFYTNSLIDAKHHYIINCYN